MLRYLAIPRRRPEGAASCRKPPAFARGVVRGLLVVLMAHALPGAAASWQLIMSDSGRLMELDRSSVRKTDGDKVLARIRIAFERPVADPTSGGSYVLIEAFNRYDCSARAFTTLKRIYRKAERDREGEQLILREEENKTPVDLPVRSGTVDDKILKTACRPTGMAGARQDYEKLVKDANDAAAEMKKANEATLAQQRRAEVKAPPRKELLKADLAQKKEGVAASKVSTTASSAPARPQLAPARAARPVARRPAPAPAADVAWAYEGSGGPEHWAELKPEYRLCRDGRRQSPIDLRDGIRVDQPEVEFRYRPSGFRLIDTDTSLEVAVSDNALIVLGKEYRLHRIRFHRPGEHRVDGREYDMSVHLEHRADDGQVAIVAINLVSGRENTIVQTLWNHLPLERYEVVAPPAASVDMNLLLPAARTYFHYMGSLTAPPCSENVVWLVMKQPVEASPDQIEIFSRLHANNARPPQAALGRRIKESR